jgi:hypothetical protein
MEIVAKIYTPDAEYQIYGYYKLTSSCRTYPGKIIWEHTGDYGYPQRHQFIIQKGRDAAVENSTRYFKFEPEDLGPLCEDIG